MSAGKYHTVVQGDYVAKIARTYGLASPLTLWNAPENKDLKELRKNPNVLYPGDRLFVPEKETKGEDRATGKFHRFERQSEKLVLRIALKDTKNNPLKGNDCTLSLETDSKQLTTTAEGMIEREMPEPDKVANGLLLDRGAGDDRPRVEIRIPLKIGHLDPESTVSGQIARLNNLGYGAGGLPEQRFTEEEEKKIVDSVEFRSAVEEFQCDFDLKVDGVCGKATQDKLLKVHGC